MPNTYILIACGAVLLVPVIGLACAIVSWRRFRREWREAVERHNRHIAEMGRGARIVHRWSVNSAGVDERESSKEKRHA